MRRDMEIIRSILLSVSKSDETIELNPLDPDDKLYDYHIDILKQANFIFYKEKFEDMIPMIYIDEPRLTWEGNDYLDNISNPNVWNKTKKVIISKGFELSDVPFSIIKELAKNHIEDILGMK